MRYLAQREHSRVELRRKLAPHAESAETLDALLDELERARYLSIERFVESVVQRRSSRFGIRRIEHEFDQHRIADGARAQALATLKSSESERAWEVWSRRFGRAPTDLAERARQHRFLSQRGFDADTVRAVLRRAGARPAGDD